MFKVEVIADDSGKWCGNMLTFQSEAEARTYAENLSNRWLAVRSWRVVKCAVPGDGELVMCQEGVR
jgi:hypothetical protein